MKKYVKTGEMIRMNSSIHRILNESGLEVQCTIFRFVSPSESQANIIKKDKRVYSDEEITRMLQR